MRKRSINLYWPQKFWVRIWFCTFENESDYRGRTELGNKTPSRQNFLILVYKLYRAAFQIFREAPDERAFQFRLAHVWHFLTLLEMPTCISTKCQKDRRFIFPQKTVTMTSPFNAENIKTPKNFAFAVRPSIVVVVGRWEMAAFSFVLCTRLAAVIQCTTDSKEGVSTLVTHRMVFIFPTQRRFFCYLLSFARINGPRGLPFCGITIWGTLLNEYSRATDILWGSFWWIAFADYT